MTVVVGLVADCLGHAVVTDLVQGYNRPELRHRCFALPATDYRSSQPRRIPLDLRHDRIIGNVVYLERDAAGLWAVATVDRLPVDLVDCVYFSPATESIDGRDIELRAVALTDQPASIAARPVRLLTGTLRDAAQHARVRHDQGIAARIDRAIDYQRRHDPHFEHTITDLRADPHDEWRLGARTVIGRPAVEWSKPPIVTGRERRTTRKPTVVTTGRRVRLPDGTVGELEYGPPGRVTSVR